MKGTATYSTDGTNFKPIKVGMSIPQSSTVKTAAESSLDLFLGTSAGVVRIAERSTLILTKLEQTQTGVESPVDIQLNLPEGEMYFNVNKLSQASRYEIKMPNGVAGIRGTKGRCNFRAADPNGAQSPPLVLVDGRLVFVQIPPGGGEPKAFVLTAPPAVTFDAANGVREAPPELARAVNGMLNQIGRPGRRALPDQGQNIPPITPFIQALHQEPVMSPVVGASRASR